MENQENQEKKHKRRVRYSGTHPRNYKEKYKELNPEKYADTISKVIQKGGTPAGMHISICVQEILDFFDIQPGQTGVDATLGYGGHTRRMLEKLQGQGHIYGLDVDPIESEKTKKRLLDAGYGPEILTVCLMNFAQLDQLAEEKGPFDFILADLGVSSMQIDNPERGFSFKVDGPLDLRLNQEAGISAAERLDTISRDELAGMLYENSDEPYCEELAKAITEEIRKGHRIDTTTKLRQVIEQTLSFLPENKEKKDIIRKKRINIVVTSGNVFFCIFQSPVDFADSILKCLCVTFFLRNYFFPASFADKTLRTSTVGGMIVYPYVFGEESGKYHSPTTFGISSVYFLVSHCRITYHKDSDDRFVCTKCRKKNKSRCK